MLFDDAQSYIAFKSSCRLSQSVTSSTPEYSLVSSVKLTSLDADTFVSRCELHNKNVQNVIKYTSTKLYNLGIYNQSMFIEYLTNL